MRHRDPNLHTMYLLVRPHSAKAAGTCKPETPSRLAPVMERARYCHQERIISKGAERRKEEKERPGVTR